MSAVTQTKLFLAATTAAILLLTACSSASKKPPPELKHIRVLPVTPIDRLYTENRSVPVGVLWQAIADRAKSSDFNERMSATRVAVAPRLTKALERELQAQGFEVSVLEGVPRPAGDPDDVDYARLPGREPVLHVYFSEMGMLSSRLNFDYLPKINVGAALITPGDDDYFYKERIYYGVEAGAPDESWSVPSDPRFKWPSFDALVDKPEMVVESYEAGVDALAVRIAKNVKALAGKSALAATPASTGTD